MNALQEEIRSGESPQLAKLSIDQYHRMNEAGILPDGSPIELIDGVLVLKDRRDAESDPMTHGTRHALLIERLRHLLEPLVHSRGFHVRTQLPVTLPPDSEPEPDLSVVRGTYEDYADRHPGPTDIALVVEVAFSSLVQDRKTKVRLYANAGLPHYWIVNLRTRRIESHADPISGEGRYQLPVEHDSGDRLTFTLDDRTVSIAVSDILK